MIVERAEDAPAEIVPGLLASTLREDGVATDADAGRLAADDPRADGGRSRRAGWGGPGRSRASIVAAPASPSCRRTLGQLPALIARLRGDDMLIAFERPPAAEREVLAIGAAGPGFDGNLTSDTTRTPGFVLATDLAPTILDRYGLEEPEEMSGSPIRSEGEPDAGRGSGPRGPHEGGLQAPRAGGAAQHDSAGSCWRPWRPGSSRGRLGRPAFALFGLSVVYLPAAVAGRGRACGPMSCWWSA